MDSLSLKNWVNSKTGLVPLSDLIKRALPQVWPPSLEVTVATPVSLLPLIVLLVASRPTEYAVPSGPMEDPGIRGSAVRRPGERVQDGIGGAHAEGQGSLAPGRPTIG
jgi:hypothetical protein